MGMQIQNNIDITFYTTFKLPAKASYFCVIQNISDLQEAFVFAQENDLDIFVLGGGSNIVIGNLEKKLVIKNEIRGIEYLGLSNFFVGAGEVWDDFVKYTVDREICCLAPLSLIPGTVGGAPIQNIGAYGTEVGNYIDQIEVFDTYTNTVIIFSKEDCNFSYRDSIFKQNHNRYVVLRVLFHLNNCICDVPNYPGIRESLIGTPDAQTIRQAIITTRQSKLPDWNVEYNVGSFFKNPEINQAQAEKMKQDFPHLKYFETGGKVKIPAGWLIEEVGLKGFKKGNFSTYEKHALVIVHNGQGSYEELLHFKKHIVDSVQEKFGIVLEQEPVEL